MDNVQRFSVLLRQRQFCPPNGLFSTPKISFLFLHASLTKFVLINVEHLADANSIHSSFSYRCFDVLSEHCSTLKH